MKKFVGIFWVCILVISALPVESLASHGGYSSSIRRKINNLDDDPVKNVSIPILFGFIPSNLVPNFGDPRSGGRKHEGLDIMAPQRALVVTPTEAVVIRTGTGESSGKHVYTANPGGEVFAYMHLDEIADIDEGDELEKGELIGYVGTTGNAKGGAPHLHFEIHDDDGDPTDPYPRLQSIFPLKDKIEYLEEILDNADDEEELAEFLVRMYGGEFALARSVFMELPAEIEKALTVVPFTNYTQLGVSNGDLKLGSTGTAVVALQKFLISKNIGSASKVVADGSFGPITQQALIDFQIYAGIKPASGYYGPITRAYIAAHP